MPNRWPNRAKAPRADPGAKVPRVKVPFAVPMGPSLYRALGVLFPWPTLGYCTPVMGAMSKWPFVWPPTLWRHGHTDLGPAGLLGH